MRDSTAETKEENSKLSRKQRFLSLFYIERNLSFSDLDPQDSNSPDELKTSHEQKIKRIEENERRAWVRELLFYGSIVIGTLAIISFAPIAIPIIIAGAIGAGITNYSAHSVRWRKTLGKGVSGVTATATGVMLAAVVSGILSPIFGLAGFMANLILYREDVPKLMDGDPLVKKRGVWQRFKDSINEARNKPGGVVAFFFNKTVVFPASFVTSYLLTAGMYFTWMQLAGGIGASLGLGAATLVAWYVVIPVMLIAFVANLAFVKRSLNRSVEHIRSIYEIFKNKEYTSKDGSNIIGRKNALLKKLFNINKEDSGKTRLKKYALIAVKVVLIMVSVGIIAYVSQLGLIKEVMKGFGPFSQRLLPFAAGYIAEGAAVVFWTALLTRVAIISEKLINSASKAPSMLRAVYQQGFKGFARYVSFKNELARQTWDTDNLHSWKLAYAKRDENGELVRDKHGNVKFDKVNGKDKWHVAFSHQAHQRWKEFKWRKPSTYLIRTRAIIKALAVTFKRIFIWPFVAVNAFANGDLGKAGGGGDASLVTNMAASFGPNFVAAWGSANNPEDRILNVDAAKELWETMSGLIEGEGQTVASVPVTPAELADNEKPRPHSDGQTPPDGLTPSGGKTPSSPRKNPPKLVDDPPSTVASPVPTRMSANSSTVYAEAAARSKKEEELPHSPRSPFSTPRTVDHDEGQEEALEKAPRASSPH